MTSRAWWLLVSLSVTLLLAASRAAFAASDGVLWLGNDNGGSVFKTDTAGAVLQEIPDTPMTGVAWDGASLYFSEAFVGTITKRTAAGVVLDTFIISPYAIRAQKV